MNAVAHPSWCSAGRCEVQFSGAHSSEPTAISFDKRGSAVVRVRVWQRPDFRLDPMDRAVPEPFVELVVGSTDSGQRCRADLTVAQTIQLESLIDAVIRDIGPIGDES